MATKGQKQRNQTPLGQARLDYRDVYGREVEDDFDPNEQEFRFKVLRPDKRDKRKWIDRLVTDCSWTEEGGSSFNNPVTMTGTLTLKKPDPDDDPDDFEVDQGHQIECYVRWPSYHGKSEGGIKERGWLMLWRMRVMEAPELSIAEGNWTFVLADDTRQLYKSTDDFSFKKKKKGKYRKGWRLDQIVKYVAHRYHFKVICPKGKVYTKKKNFKDQSPMEVILWAVREESRETGNMFVIRWDDKRLRISPVRRNPKLYTFGKLITEATISRTTSASVATSMMVHWSQKVKGGTKKKPKTKARHTRVKNEKLVRKYGYIHAEATAPKKKVDSRSEVKGWINSEFQRRSLKVPHISFSHPGVAMVRKGDAIKLKLPDYGFAGIKKGATGLGFVQTITHNLSAGSYTMDIEVSFRDMLDPEHLRKLKDKALRAKAKREAEAARKAAGGNGGGGGGGGGGGAASGAIAGSPVPGMAVQSTTHETGGLSGYPAADYMCPAGTTCVAPVSGTIDRLSGSAPGSHCPPGGPCGYSIYMSGGGKSYFLTHLDNVSVRVGQSVSQGQPIAVVADGPPSWSSPHVHMGING